MDEGVEETEEAVVWPSLSSLEEGVGTSAFRCVCVGVSAFQGFLFGLMEVRGRDASLCA